MKVRKALKTDVVALADIYNQGIRARIATFETVERSDEDILLWFERDNYPLLVAEVDGVISGWVSASSYRDRACYQSIAEFSIYIHQDFQGRGVGSQLMKAFLPACKDAGFSKVLSRIFPENIGSLALCKKFGFREVGVYEKHAKLDGVWRDVVIVEQVL